MLGPRRGEVLKPRQPYVEREDHAVLGRGAGETERYQALQTARDFAL